MTTFTETTSHITISVEPIPIEEESQVEAQRYVFAYTVRIKNSSADTVQLLARHWIIESAGEQIGEVEGEGVVGLQPTLQPGEEFEYTSSTVISDPIGAMYGSYLFYGKSEGTFRVSIPRFNLVYPALVH